MEFLVEWFFIFFLFFFSGKGSDCSEYEEARMNMGSPMLALEASLPFAYEA